MSPQGQLVGYARVSSSDQNLARQIAAIGSVDRLFTDTSSGGSRAARPGLADCMEYLRAGDTLRVAAMDRLARSVVDLDQLVTEFTAKGAAVHFVKESQTFTSQGNDPMSRLLLHVLGAFAEFERSLIRERQAEGIRIAKAAGKYRGRTRSLSDEKIALARERLECGVSKSRVAADLGVDRSTLYRALARAFPPRTDQAGLGASAMP